MCGDSGGPLFCIKNDELILYGIVSYGGHICGNAKEPGVYAKVASVNSWILQYVKGKAKYLYTRLSLEIFV